MFFVVKVKMYTMMKNLYFSVRIKFNNNTAFTTRPNFWLRNILLFFICSNSGVMILLKRMPQESCQQFDKISC